MRFKFIHAADIHLDSPLRRLEAYEGAPVKKLRRATRRAFENLVDLALDQAVSFVLIAGDLYDGDWRDYNTGLYLISQLRRLRLAGIPIYMVAGNHDAASQITKTLKLPEGVTLFPSTRPATQRVPTADAAIHGQSFATAAVTEDLSAGYPPPVAGCFNIGLLHTCATGREGHDPYAPCSVQGLRAKGYDYWALGHVHQHEVLHRDPPIVFSGCIQGRHIGETGPRGCMLGTVTRDGNCQMEFKPLDVIRWAALEINASGAKSGDAILDLFRTRLLDVHKGQDHLPLVVRVTIAGETAAHPELAADPERWTNEIRAAAIDISGGRVWVEKIRLLTQLLGDQNLLDSPGGPMAELSSYLNEIQEDVEALKVFTRELAILHKKLPAPYLMDADNLDLKDPAWIAGLLGEIRPMLVKRLLKKGMPA